MKRASDAGLLFGAVGLSAAALVGAAAVAGAMLRSPGTARAEPAGPASAATPLVGEPVATGPLEADGVPTPPAPTAVERSVTDEGGGLSPQVLALAAERAPFDPERRAPEGRYLFPEERVEPAPPPEPRAPPTPPFRVVGTVAGSSEGVAVLQPEGQTPRVLGVGDEILGFRVSAIEGNVVVVSSQGWELSLPVESLQPTRAGSSTSRNNQRGQNDRNRREQERAEERALEQMRERLQQIARQMQQQTGGPVRVEMQGDRAVIVGPDGVRQEIRIPGGGNVERPNITMLRVAPGVQARPGGGR